MLQVPHQVVREVASAQQLARLQNYALRSFVEDSRTLTWCPAPGTQPVKGICVRVQPVTCEGGQMGISLCTCARGQCSASRVSGVLAFSDWQLCDQQFAGHGRANFLKGSPVLGGLLYGRVQLTRLCSQPCFGRAGYAGMLQLRALCCQPNCETGWLPGLELRTK